MQHCPGGQLLLIEAHTAPDALQVLGEYFCDYEGDSLLAVVGVTVVVHGSYGSFATAPGVFQHSSGPLVVWTPATLNYSATRRNGFANRCARPS
ncbi:MAG TPA: hypothetical protein VHA54_06075 [Solirubrobacterales bacterium]|nr:hypothetical protein [Solirubrobacterales bacterium]